MITIAEFRKSVKNLSTQYDIKKSNISIVNNGAFLDVTIYNSKFNQEFYNKIMLIANVRDISDRERPGDYCETTCDVINKYSRQFAGLVLQFYN